MTNSDLQYLDPIAQCGLRGLDGYIDAANWAFVKDNNNGHVHFIGRACRHSKHGALMPSKG